MAVADGGGGHDEAEGDLGGWSDLLQSLIGAGHPPAAVLDYTMDQVSWWHAAIVRDRFASIDMQARLVATRLGIR
jgi:hypothetical protein